MLLNSHDLDTVVTILDDTWQNIFLKLCIGTNFFSILAHTDVAFVNQQRSRLWLESFFLPYVWFRIPNLCRENLGLFILYHSSCPSRNALAFSTSPVNFHLEKITMLQRFLRELEFPVSCTLNTFSTILWRLFPVIEITNQIDISSIRSPLTEHPSAVSLMQTEILVAIGEITQGLLTVLGQLTQFPQSMIMSALNCILIRFEIGVILHQTDMFRSCSSLHCLFCCSSFYCLFSSGFLAAFCFFCCHILMILD